MKAEITTSFLVYYSNYNIVSDWMCFLVSAQTSVLPSILHIQNFPINLFSGKFIVSYIIDEYLFSLKR